MARAKQRYCLGDIYGRIGHGDPVGRLYDDEATARAVAARIPAERRRYGVTLYSTDDLRNHGSGVEIFPPAMTVIGSLAGVTGKPGEQR